MGGGGTLDGGVVDDRSTIHPTGWRRMGGRKPLSQRGARDGDWWTSGKQEEIRFGDGLGPGARWPADAVVIYRKWTSGTSRFRRGPSVGLG